jgi:hypothetical protein
MAAAGMIGMFGVPAVDVPSPTHAVGFGGAASDFVSLPNDAIPVTPQPQQPQHIDSKLSAVAGGTTIHGKKFVPDVATYPIDEKDYTKVGETIVLTLQLVCRQTEAQKKIDNLSVTLVDDGYAYLKSLYDRKQHELEAIQKRLREVQLEAITAEFELNLVKQRNTAILSQFSPQELSDLQAERGDEPEPESLKNRKAAKQREQLIKF